jgi:hypothetical protein
MHFWGDDFDWEALNKSISYCIQFWKRWGRIGSHGKEKFGAFRDHPYFWDGGLWSLIRPGYVYIGGPILCFIYYRLDEYIIRPFTKFTGIYRLGLWYQSQVYNYAIQKMCKKYPHIVDELVSHLEGYEMIKPGIFGKIDGKKIHDKHWRKM